MARRAPRICIGHGCTALASVGSRCADCELIESERRRAARQAYDKGRAGDAARQLYRTRGWIVGRGDWLREHPYCVRCEARGVRTLATEVDHIRPHRGDRRLFFGRWNWQSICRPCHSRKTACEDGGFGRPRIIGEATR